MAVRVLYTDIDGTLVGPMGSLFARSDGRPTLAAAAALHRAHIEGLEVVALSGRSRFGLDEVARLLGLTTWFGELGAVRVYQAGKQVVEDPGEWPGPGRVVDALVPAMDGILKEYAGLTEEHSPWNRGREHSVMVRGEPPFPEVRAWLDGHGYGWVEMVENGLVPAPHHSVAGFEHVRVWHLTPRGISKRTAIAADRAFRGLAREETAMVGDAVSDFECHTEVGRCFVMRNGVDRDAGLAELVDGARAVGEDVAVTAAGHTEGWAEVVDALLAER